MALENFAQYLLLFGYGQLSGLVQQIMLILLGMVTGSPPDTSGIIRRIILATFRLIACLILLLIYFCSFIVYTHFA